MALGHTASVRGGSMRRCHVVTALWFGFTSHVQRGSGTLRSGLCCITAACMVA